MEVVYQCYYAA